MNFLKRLLSLIVIGFAISAQAKVELPSIFGDHMVLQRESMVSVWGKATPNTNVKITTSWNARTYDVKSDSEGKWQTKVQTPEAGGPYDVSFSDGEEFVLKNVLIGEVWICSGQSNMQMQMRGLINQPIPNSNIDIAKARNESIRFFTVGLSTSLTPQGNVVSGEWKECNPMTASWFSAAGYYFGRLINEALDVPVGLICTSWGGTRIEPWIGEEAINELKFVKTPDIAEGEEVPNSVPSVLFNAMINPLVGYGIRGAIWYQGEANHKQPEHYAQLQEELIKNWRSEWGIGDFPFYYAQIAPFGYNSGTNSAYLREAQLKASTSLPNIGMACQIDIGEEKCIHPGSKKIIGERLAFLALSKTYKNPSIAYSGPVFREMEINDGEVELFFDHAELGLTTYGKPLTNFMVAGKDKKFYPAEAKIKRWGYTKKVGVVLSSPEVPKPVAVRYAFEDFVVGELYNVEGLPASSFRTDDW